MSHPDYPLFPLDTVVFPDGVLPLRIFEPRYLDLVSMCMKRSTGFGICVARPANNGGFSLPHSVGTLVEIVDFDRLEDGCLGITVEGRRRFNVLSTRQAGNGLWWGTVEFIREGLDVDCPAEFDTLREIAEALLEQADSSWSRYTPHYNSALWLSARLTELLPFDPATKHTLLATSDPIERLRYIQPLVRIDSNRT